MPQTDNSHFTKTLLISIVATVGGFLFGFDSGVINGTVDGLSQAFNTDAMGAGFNVASMLLGCAAGAFFAGNLADHFGRRSLLLVAAVCFTISAWGSGISASSLEFILYRVLGGLAVGAASVLAPAYISEVAPARIRGRLSSIQQIAIIFGLFAAFLSNYLIAHSAGGSALNELALGYQAWRWMFWVEIVPAVLFFFALLCIPESPRFLVASGKKEKAIQVLHSLMGERAADKYQQIKATLAADHRPSFRDIACSACGLRPIVWVGIALAAFQQLVGINVVFYYGAVLWQSVGFTEANALLINILSGAISIGACIAALTVIDKIGRKPMLVAGSIGMTLSLGTVAFIFATAASGAEAGQLQLSGNAGLIALVAANLYVAIFNFSWGPVMWVTLAEMFPNQMRGSGLAISGLALWIANFAITMTFPMLLNGIGLGAAYAIYAAFAAVSAPFVFKFVRETKGLELEAMQG